VTIQTSPTLARLEVLPDGPEGTAETLKIMRSLIRAGKKSLPVRLLALELTKNGLRQKNWVGEVSRIHAFVRDKIRYIKDIRGVETLQTVEKTLEFKQGDCDDKTILTAALLESIGHPTRIVAVGFHGNNYSHVFPETKIGGEWISVETTEPVALGWRPSHVKNRMVVTV